MATDEEDPLVQALPPATDYLTYLTLLEYQLTPARLPLLHRLLQDEVLTTNIGWDVVKLLLPMLPQSQECLQDVARLGNPREVILQVAESLMKLEPEEEDSSDDAEETEEAPLEIRLEENVEENFGGSAITSDEEPDGPDNTLPLHVVQFNSLVAMLSVLHGRIKTQYPSRFVATSLPAVLEAYGLMATNETTTAVLELLRDLSPSKRPALPPRGASEGLLVRVSEASAPDPEAESHSDLKSPNDSEIVRKLVQLGLIEVLKMYLLSLSAPTDSGVSWALRLQERLGPEQQLVAKLSKTHIHTTKNDLKERDLIVGKIASLSRDFGLKDDHLLQIVSLAAEEHPAELDFEELPKRPEEIPLERHGALLLLAARLSTTILFSRPNDVRVPIYPDLAVIFSNFIGIPSISDAAAPTQPQALQDALLAITVISVHDKVEEPADDEQYTNLVLSLTTCSAQQSYNSLRRIPSIVARSHPSEIVRFKLIRRVLEKEELLFARESAIGWLKDEILGTVGLDAEKKGMSNSTTELHGRVFADPHHFSVLFPLLFNPAELFSLDLSSGIVVPWLRFSQTLAPSIHAALSLYYVLLCSQRLRDQLELGKTYLFFRNRFLTPLKSLCHTFEEDMTENGGDGHIESAVGEEMCQTGMARSVGLLYHVIEQVEERLADYFEHDDAAIKEPSADDIARVAEIRAATAV